MHRGINQSTHRPQGGPGAPSAHAVSPRVQHGAVSSAMAGPHTPQHFFRGPSPHTPQQARAVAQPHAARGAATPSPAASSQQRPAAATLSVGSSSASGTTSKGTPSHGNGVKQGNNTSEGVKKPQASEKLAILRANLKAQQEEQLLQLQRHHEQEQRQLQQLLRQRLLAGVPLPPPPTSSGMMAGSLASVAAALTVGQRSTSSTGSTPAVVTYAALATSQGGLSTVTTAPSTGGPTVLTRIPAVAPQGSPQSTPLTARPAPTPNALTRTQTVGATVQMHGPEVPRTSIQQSAQQLQKQEGAVQLQPTLQNLIVGIVPTSSSASSSQGGPCERARADSISSKTRILDTNEIMDLFDL